LLLDVDLKDPRVQSKPDSWPAIGMDASCSLEVAFDDLVVPEEAAVGPQGFYTRRCGFALGGAGVAAVWLGGAVGALDLALAVWSSGRSPDPHGLAHLGALHTEIASTDALLVLAAEVIDAEPAGDHELLVGTCRSAAEKTARAVIDVVPRLVGPGPLCWDRRLAQRLADLQVYVRQHHGEADLAKLGSRILTSTPQPS
jgi:alkylation response protein AidB-like acyl-CoA dehydrogenase